MEEKEKLLLEIKGLIADSQKESVNAKDLETKIAAINKSIAEKLDNAGMAALKEGVDKLIEATAANAAAIKAMNETAVKKEADKPMSFKDALVAAIMAKKDVAGLLTEKNDDYGKRFSLKEYFTDQGHKNSPEFIVKTEMLESSIVQTNVALARLTDLDPKRVGIPLTIYPHVTDWMPSKNIKKPYMSILVVYSYSDGAATKTEGSASTISSFLLKTVEFKAFFIATYFTLSDETLDDLEEAMEEIAVTAPSKILDKVDTYVLGSAGNDTTAIAGILTSTKKTDFASGSTYASFVNNANMIDVIATMKLQCEVNKYIPNAVLMSPSDTLKLGAAKDQLDNSITDRRVVFDVTGEPTAVCGLKIIKSTAITADDCIVLDSNQLMLGKRKDMTMEIGYNGTDLTEGQKTVVIKVRIAFGVRDASAVIYTNGIASALSAITIL